MTRVVASSHSISAVHFTSEQDATPVPWTGPALDLIGRRHLVRPAKKGTPCWSPVAYAEGATRGKRGVRFATALALDFDHVPPIVESDVFAAVRDREWAYVAASSYSHQATGPDDRCFRLLLFVGRDVQPREYGILWSQVHAVLGGHSDRAARDISRIWYVASCPPERARGAWVRHGDGFPVDVDAVLEQAGVQASASAVEPEAEAPDDGFSPIPQGRRTAFLLSLAGAMRRRGVDSVPIAAALAATNAARCRPPLEAVDIERIAASVCRYDAAAPLLAANLSDIGNAERFEAFVGARFRYVHPWAAWLAYDGRRWARDADGASVRASRDTLRATAALAAAMPEGKPRDAVERHALHSERGPRVSAMLTLAQSLLPVAIDALDRDLDRLNVLNGTVDLLSGTIASHAAGDLLTRLVPVAFDPTAEAPQWEAFLHRVLGGDAALIGFIQRAVGYSLTGRADEQVLFLLHGTGANGKSTFIETLRALLGDYATIADFSTFLRRDSDGARNDLARLVGARFVPAVEADAGAFLAESLVKQVTGGDTITARFLFREYFDYRPQFKIWLAANHKPNVSGTDHGIWRRIRLIPFTVTIPECERDPRLAARLLAELPGILAWAVRGCLAWRTQGLGLPDAVRDATSSYRDEMDVFAGFLDGRCVADAAARTTAKDLYAAYQAWCAANGEKERSQKALGKRLLERGFGQVKGSGGVRCWQGIRFRGPDEADRGEWRVAHQGASAGIPPHDHTRAREGPEPSSPIVSSTATHGAYPDHAPTSATRHSPRMSHDEWQDGTSDPG